MSASRLGDICEFKYGRSLPEMHRDAGDYLVFGSNGPVGTHSEAITSGPTIVIGRKGSVGEVNIAETDCWPIDTTYYVDGSATEVDIRWLYHALKGMRLPDLNKATGIPGLNRSDAYDRRLVVPSASDQKRIAAILDQADELRRVRRRALNLLATLGRTIFYNMFGDPVTNPKGWNIAKLGDLCAVGSSKRVFVSEFVKEGVPFYRGTEIGKLGAGENVRPHLHIKYEHYEKLVQQLGKPEIGDLLLPSICDDGRIWRVNHRDPFYFKDGRVLWIKSHACAIDSEYLRSQLRNIFLQKYLAIASGTTFAELKIVNLKNLSVACPPIDLQVEFSSRIAEVERRRSELHRSEIEINRLLTSLQHRAFRGEL